MQDARFHTTRWSLVLCAGDADDALHREALEQLCRSYWYPLYAFLRREGKGPDEAADLVQGLFGSLFERDSLQRLDREGGRFRSWLLKALQRHVKDERVRAASQKRGGGVPVLSLDSGHAESRLRIDPADPRSTLDLFQRDWALSVIEGALARLRAERAAQGKAGEFELLEGFLKAEGQRPDAVQIAERLGKSAVAVRVAAHRLRERYRELLVEEVRATLDDDLDPGEELAELLAALQA